MAELPLDPKGLELEDFIAAHFVSRGCYVEAGVKERDPDEILELDIVWSDYRSNPPVSHPVEVKSGDWGLGDIFKFYGWTRYLNLESGEFAHKIQNGRLSQATLTKIEDRTKIKIIHIPNTNEVEQKFDTLGLQKPAWEDLPGIWQYSFRAQRRLLKSLTMAIKLGISLESAKAAKDYHQLINDAVFFVPDMRDRISELLSAHFKHKQLAASMAYELETNQVNFDLPPVTKSFRTALYQGKHFPIQACLYLENRARLYILKAVVDFWMARERGDIPKTVIKLGDYLIDLTSGQLTQAMATGINQLSSAKSFCMFPIFWQVFLWSWGGFLLKDRRDEEYTLLAKETGVPIDEIDIALGAFDKLFPVNGGWFREPPNDSRKILMLMPAAMRGIGAFRRKINHNIEHYKELGYDDTTTYRMAQDHNTGAKILDCSDNDLPK